GEPVLPERSVQRLEMPKRFTHVRQTEKSECDNNDDGRDGNEKREPAGLFRTEQVEQPNREDRGGRKVRWVRHAEILKREQSAERRRDQIVGDQQKRANDRDHFTAMSQARQNA